jgi:hypothetical protein
MTGPILRAPKSLILPASGGGQAYAERTTATGQIGAGDGVTAVDIPSLTISPVPDTTQMLVILHCPRVDKSAVAGWVSIQIFEATGSIVHNFTLQSIPASSFAGLTVYALITGLTPGTARTLKAQLTTSASTAAVFGAATQKPFIAALRA